MKKLIFIIVALLFFVYNYGQSYHPLPDSNAKWCIMFNNGFIPPPFHWYTNYWETSYSGDTIITNHEYKKIEKTEYDIFCLNTVIKGPEYIGAIRDDTIQKQVFYVPPGIAEEKLIYDFNLELGDTLFSYLEYYQPLIVDFVDSILIDDVHHKRIVFQFGEAEIIEGIGSKTGLLEKLIAFEGGSYLCALYIDTTFIFPEYPCNLSATDTCLTLIIEPQFKKPDILIFPNPNNGTFQIQSTQQENLTFQKLSIYNLEGKAVFVSENPELLQSEIELPSLPNGMYFALLAFRESNYSVKFLIQR